jgi:hypothetical protein
VKILIKNAALFLLILCIAGTFPVFAAEESQFDLFAADFNLPFGDRNNTCDPERLPDRLENVLYGELPASLKSCFDSFGGAKIHIMDTDENENPNMTWDDVEKLTFTGPYYQFAMDKSVESMDMADFRRGFVDIPILVYLIRLDNKPAGLLHVTFDGDKYSIRWLSSSGNAENFIRELDRLSTSRRLADDVIFLSIRGQRFIVNKDDQVFSSIWMTEPASFSDLVKSAYIVQREIEANISANVDGGNFLTEYIHNPDAYLLSYTGIAQSSSISQVSDLPSLTFLPWVFCGLAVMAVAYTLLLKKRKKA